MKNTPRQRFLKGGNATSAVIFCCLVSHVTKNLEPATAHAASHPGHEVVTQQGGSGIAARTEEPGCHSRTWTGHRKPVQN